MLKLRFLLCCCSAVLGLAAGAWADTVVLKNGDKVNGRILSENDAQVTLEVQVTATIKDEQVIKKADIARIDKVQPDEVAWPNIKDLALGKDSFEAADYQRAEGLLQSFVTQFPTSSHAADATAKLAEFTAEQKRVTAGDLKVDGKWLTKEEAEDERVQIAGRQLYNRMAHLAAAGQFVDAMNLYDTLEKTYPGSAAMVDAIELARKVVPNIEAAAKQQREHLKAQADINRKRLETAQGQEREQLATMLRNEAAAANAAADAASKSTVKWPALVPVEGLLNTIASRASSEAANLKSKPVEKMREAIAAGEDAKKALAANDLAAAEKVLNTAQSAWSNYELIKRLQTKLATAKKDAIAAKTAADAAAIADAAAAKDKAEKAAKAAKQAKEDKEAKDAAAAAAAATAAADQPKETETPFYEKPILWVVLILLGLFGALGMKAYHKFRDPNRNLLDQ